MVMYAQSWMIDGNMNLARYKWNNSYTSEETRDISLSLKAGKYVTDNINIGLKAGFGVGETGNLFTIGPFIKVDGYKIEKVYLAITGGIYYTRYNGSYSWNATYSENDANRVVFQVSPSLTYMVNKNIELYWQFATLSYRYDWLTLKNTNTNCKADEFRIAGPFANPTFGLIFKF